MKFKTIADVKKEVLKHGNLDPEENERIFKKEFLYAFQVLKRISRYYDFEGEKILDIGSGYGEFLVHFGKGSMGIECRPDSAAFSHALGFETKAMNVEDDFTTLPEKFDVVFCRQVLDHLVSPHKFLVEAWEILNPEGHIVLSIDNIYYLFGFKLPVEHLEGFSMKSLEIVIRKAGFLPEKFFTILSAKPYAVEWLFNHNRWLLNRCKDLYIVAKKDEHFKYDEKRIDAFTPRWMTVRPSFNNLRTL